MIPPSAPKKLYHTPVMLQEVLEEVAMAPKEGWIVDTTFGDGGHSKAIYAQRVAKFDLNRLLSIDWDLSGYRALSTHATELPTLLVEAGESTKWVLVEDNFSHLKQILRNAAQKIGYGDQIAAILLDLGISSRQLVQKERGFSFAGKGKADMRMNPDMYAIAAYDLLNLLPYTKLTKMFRDTVGMPGPLGAKLTRELLAAREERLFGHSDDISRLTNIAHRVVPIRAGSRGRIHPATLLFLALRIAVNTELQNLREVLPTALSQLVKGGVILVMTYHSGEEEVVSAFIAEHDVKGEVITPSAQEIRKNPRARSAKLFIMKHV
jgi:16S rRNA (cytosine1402-N4)-methyltransferase